MHLNEKEAYLAMTMFLTDYFERGKSDDIAVLLGSMTLLHDKTTADPALWHDWMDAIERSKQSKGKLE